MPAHEDIVDDAFLHEAKGASTAVLNTVLTSNGDGSTSFTTVSYNNLTDTPVIEDLGYENVLVGVSTATSQEPVASDDPIQVEFGALQDLTDVTLAADGTITINTDGYYSFTFLLRFGRSSSTGTAILYNRFLINDVQVGPSNSFSLVNSGTVTPFTLTLKVFFSAGTTLKSQIYVDSSGNLDGGLYQSTPSLAGWSDAASASVAISRIGGASS